MWLGNKAIRAGISASLCVLAANLLNLKYPFFAALPAVMPLATNLHETIKSGSNRTIGSAIGAAVGIVLALIHSSSFLLTGMGVIIIIYICRFINWESSASIGCLIFISIMVGLKGETAWVYSLHRLLATFIGIAITTAVNNLAFSINIRSAVMKSIETIYDNLLKAAKCKIIYNAEPSTDKLHERINTFQGLLNIYKDQLRFSKNSRSRFSHVNLLYKNLKYAAVELDIIKSMENSCSLNDENLKRINSIFNCEKSYVKCPDNEIDIVYNYHLGRLLKGIDTVKQNIKK